MVDRAGVAVHGNEEQGSTSTAQTLCGSSACATCSQNSDTPFHGQHICLSISPKASTTSIPLREHNPCQGSSYKRKEEEKQTCLQTVILFPFPSPIDFFFNPFLCHSQQGNASVLLSPGCPLRIIQTLRLLQKKELEVVPSKCVKTEH